MEYRYDGLGRRIFSVDLLNNTETYHEHYGDMEVMDYAVTRDPTTGQITNYDALYRVILGTGVDSRLGYHDVQGDELSFPLVNHQGSTVMMIDETGKRMIAEGLDNFVYDPYGNEVKGASEGGYPYRYTGRRYDAQTGLYYYRARYYDPYTGRFLQTDPIGTADQMNLYAYVGNDPVNATDPMGKETYRLTRSVFPEDLQKKIAKLARKHMGLNKIEAKAFSRSSHSFFVITEEGTSLKDGKILDVYSDGPEHNFDHSAINLKDENYGFGETVSNNLDVISRDLETVQAFIEKGKSTGMMEAEIDGMNTVISSMEIQGISNNDAKSLLGANDATGMPYFPMPEHMPGTSNSNTRMQKAFFEMLTAGYGTKIARSTGKIPLFNPLHVPY